MFVFLHSTYQSIYLNKISRQTGKIKPCWYDKKAELASGGGLFIVNSKKKSYFPCCISQKILYLQQTNLKLNS